MTDRLDAVRRDWDSRAERWDGLYDGGGPGGPSFHDHTIADRLDRAGRLAAAVTGADDVVLDAGCGAGQLAALLSGRGLRVAAFDVAEAMARTASARLAAGGGGATLVGQADAGRLPFRDGSFALVCGLGLIEYLADPAAGMAELGRVLAPGGHLIVTAPNPARLAYLLDPVGVVRGRRASRHSALGYQRRYWTAGGLRRLVEGAGLRLVRLEGHGLGPLCVGGRPVLSDSRAIAVGERLQRTLPERATRLLGADLVALARR